MNRAENKANRLIQIEQLLLGHPEGLTQAEIARRLGVHRSTIYRCLPDLGERFVIEETEDGRLRIDRSKSLVHVQFNLHEALAVHLASRLLATRMDRQNPHAAAALRKLGLALKELAPRISRHLLQSADVMDDPGQLQDPSFLGVLEKLTLAWAEQRVARIWHRSEQTGRVYEYLFAPYFIEPYAVGQSIHTIGLSRPVGKLRTLKVERIERAELTREGYEIPAEFDPRELLKDAWGIWYSENEPVEVRLRFHPRVAGRVRESRWHRSEELREEPDGYLTWRARVAEPREMLPWIRGWGADVEVVGPRELREKMIVEAQRMAEVYREGGNNRLLIAHIRERDGEYQSLQNHLTAVSLLTGQFAQKFGLKETGELLGLLHDFGKASEEFQNYLLSANGKINPDADGYIDPENMKGKIDHSTAGAQVIYEALQAKGSKDKVGAQFMALCIASHHSGLIDCLTPGGEDNFKRRLTKADKETHKTEAASELSYITSQVEELLSKEVVDQIFMRLRGLQVAGADSNKTSFFKTGLLIRSLLSCLIDADRLDTADFESPDNFSIRNYGDYIDWKTLVERLDGKLVEFAQKRDRNEVDELRSQVSQACFASATKPKGIYQLTVPTGGGKTLSSLRFALNHAACHQMDRVFYIIPYTTIIDQNANEIRKILEDKDERGNYLDRVVLEHHSNLTPEEESRRQNLLAQNWDAPVVLTTQVQFLEALFGSGTRGVRRMHQLANSVIILDEVQTIPINIVQMLNIALRYLVENCGSTVVLCTATQPPLGKLEAHYRSLTIQPDLRIIQDEQALFERLRRVEVFDRRKVGGWSEAEVADLAEEQLQEKGSVLIVVNTKKNARLLYQTIAGRRIENLNLLHLSTNMCPAHRLDILEKIKAELEANQRVVCVSTQLIEAGVDIDFGAVIRYLAGLDSIAQSAGRCNRHGIRPGLGNVFIVNPAVENVEMLKDIVAGKEKAQFVLDEYANAPERFGNDRTGLQAIATYYQSYYRARENEMRYPVDAASPIGREDDLFNLLSTNSVSIQAYERVHHARPEMVFPQSFQSAARAFRVIDAPTRGVIVQYGDEGRTIVEELCSKPVLEKQYRLLKRAQRFSVNLFPEEFNRLMEAGAVHEAQKGTGVFYLDREYYSMEIGWEEDPENRLDFLHV